ncbi:MAG: D-alanyl-D-alanine carboxypeptidase [Clostridia bacterium]|nr:D-alanyl-D-alanine carboxypeptidase [Clostridia bacterium]
MNKIKKIICICLMFFSIFFTRAYAVNSLDLQSKYVGIYNAENMELLYGKNQDQTIQIASMTKIMTAIISVENIPDLNEKITIDYDIIASNLDSDLAVCGIENGQTLTYYDLVATTLIPSGADSALYLAYTVFNDYSTFITKMNDKAYELGLENTHFDNPVGLDSNNNYSTISDVAKLLDYALENDTLKEIMSMSTYTTSDGNITVSHTINKTANRNGINITHILGGKTGTTGDAGICLASYSNDDGVELISVVAGASMYSTKPHNIIDTENLYEYIKSNYDKRDIVSQGENVLNLTNTACEDTMSFYVDKSITRYTSSIDKSKLDFKYIRTNDMSNLMIKDSKVGEVEVYYNGEYLEKVDLKLSENIDFEIIDWAKKNLLGIS